MYIFICSIKYIKIYIPTYLAEEIIFYEIIYFKAFFIFNHSLVTLNFDLVDWEFNNSDFQNRFSSALGLNLVSNGLNNQGVGAQN